MMFLAQLNCTSTIMKQLVSDAPPKKKCKKEFEEQVPSL